MRIVTIYPVIGRYRVPIFAELHRSACALGHSHEFHADPHNRVDSVELADFAEVSDPGYRLHFPWHADVRNRTLGKWLWQSGALRVALRRDIDAIVFLGVCWHLSTWVAAMAARLSGKRVLFWTHGLYGTESRARRIFRITFLRIAHHVMFYGNHARMLAEQAGLPAKRLSTIYNSLDVESQRSLRALLLLDDEQLERHRADLFKDPTAPILVFVGRLIPEKRLDMLLDAMAELRSRNVVANALLIGSGPAEEMLRKKASALGLSEHLRFIGKCYEESRLAPLIAMSDICVTPGSIGLTCMHALAYGTPVITHDDPCTQGPEFEAVVPGLTGDLFRKGDASHLATVIAGWLATRPDRAVTRERCYEEIERRWTPSTMSARINKAIGIGP
jgi:glycosyltransferase involved in cell wall biosynthesis